MGKGAKVYVTSHDGLLHCIDLVVTTVTVAL